jgi:two-component system, sensor histidine kinase
LNLGPKPELERAPLDANVFRAIAEFTYDWESWIDGTGRVVWVNAAVERVTGYSVAECLLLEDYPLPLAHPDDRGLLREISAQAERGESGNHVEFRIVRKDGKTRWGAISFQPIFDASGVSLGYRSSVRDIEERKQMEERLRALVIEAEQASQAKTQFLANVSHELRTPLQSLLNYAELLERADIHEQYRGFARLMRQEGEHLGRLVLDLLDYAALAAGELSIVERRYFPRAEFEPRLRALEKEATSKGLELEWRLPAKHVEVEGDPDRALQILTNLARNAIQYTSHGWVEVSFDVDERAALARLRVRDTGPGLPPALQIFEPFRRGDSGALGPGFGLGLAITARLCERMGGSLKSGAAPGGGAEMVAEFSARPVGPAPLVRANPGRNRALLVIDDVESVRDALVVSAESLGRLAYGAASLEQAFALIETEAEKAQAWAALLDLNMPGATALANVHALRARLGPDAWLFVMSASPLGALKHEFEAAGADGFFAKPIGLERLQNLFLGETQAWFRGGSPRDAQSEVAFRTHSMLDPSRWDLGRLGELDATRDAEGRALTLRLRDRLEQEFARFQAELAEPWLSGSARHKILHDLAGAALSVRASRADASWSSNNKRSIPMRLGRRSMPTRPSDFRASSWPSSHST